MTKTKGKWIHTQALGTLFLEQVLVYFDVPELFVCTDADDRRYLVVFVDDENKITRITSYEKGGQLFEQPERTV